MPLPTVSPRVTCTHARRLFAGLCGWLVAHALGLLLAATAGLPGTAMASQGVELLAVQASKQEGALRLDFTARVTLPRAVEEALQRGVPVYFVAEAALFANRWYWRDERVARVSRQWRLALQPLTGTWRVSMGGLNQSYASMDEALASVSRVGGWRLADAQQLDPDKSYYVEFGYRLDTTQLPGPLLFGMPNLGGNSEWAIGVNRTLKVDP
jgi:Domain of unknown function (DUF4390)